MKAVENYQDWFLGEGLQSFGIFLEPDFDF